MVITFIMNWLHKLCDGFELVSFSTNLPDELYGNYWNIWQKNICQALVAYFDRMQCFYRDSLNTQTNHGTRNGTVMAVIVERHGYIWQQTHSDTKWQELTQIHRWLNPHTAGYDWCSYAVDAFLQIFVIWCYNALSLYCIQALIVFCLPLMAQYKKNSVFTLLFFYCLHLSSRKGH